MLDETQKDDRLIENLADTGLCAGEIERFLSCYSQNKRAAQMKILSEYRGKLLTSMQDNQEKLYRLDYLIRRLKTEKRDATQEREESKGKEASKGKGELR